MLNNLKIDDRLLVSETSLVYIPRDKFEVDSWRIFDEFMTYATDIFAATLASLINMDCIKVLEKEVKRFGILGITISTNTNYIIQLRKKPSSEFVLGWLEGKIIEQFKHSAHNNLDAVINDTLSEIFDNNHNLANPGKVLVLQILRNQKMNLYDFNHKENLIVNTVTVRYRVYLANPVKPRIYKLDDFSLSEIEISVLRRLVDAKLRKFQNFD